MIKLKSNLEEDDWEEDNDWDEDKDSLKDSNSVDDNISDKVNDSVKWLYWTNNSGDSFKMRIFSALLKSF